MNYKAIEDAHIEAEARYPIHILSSWVTGSQHNGLANEDSDIDVTAIYMQDPIELVCQNPSPKDRITTVKVGKVELKLISLQEFGRYIKTGSAQAFETLFCSTEHFNCYDNLVPELKELFFDTIDRNQLIKAMMGIAHRNHGDYQSNSYRGLKTSNKILMIVAKYALLSHLVGSKDIEYFKEVPDLAKIALEDPEVPSIIKQIYELYNTPEAYHETMDLTGERLFATLSGDLETLDHYRIRSNRIGWKDEEYKELDRKVDSLVVQYHREAYSF